MMRGGEEELRDERGEGGEWRRRGRGSCGVADFTSKQSAFIRLDRGQSSCAQCLEGLGVRGGKQSLENEGRVRKRR
jgi:hypothetical protein